jgi:hypothetical protein
MSEERLAAIEEKIDRLIGSHEVFQGGQDAFRAGQDELRLGQEALRADVRRIDERIVELDRHMHVLHEDVIARIAAIPTDVPSRAEMFRAVGDQGEAFARRLDPLEAAVRQHSAEIERLKGSQG